MQRRGFLTGMAGFLALTGSVQASARWDLKPAPRNRLVMAIIPETDFDDSSSEPKPPQAASRVQPDTDIHESSAGERGNRTETGRPAQISPAPPARAELLALPVAIFLGVAAALYAGAELMIERRARARRTTWNAANLELGRRPGGRGSSGTAPCGDWQANHQQP